MPSPSWVAAAALAAFRPCAAAPSCEGGLGDGTCLADASLQSATLVFLHLVSDDERHHAPLEWQRPSGDCRLRADGGFAEEQRRSNMDGFRRLLPDLKANFLERFPYPVTLFYSPFEGAQQDLQEFRDLLGDTPVEAVSLPSFGRENFYPPLRDNYSSFENPCRTDAAFHKGGHCSWYHFSYKQMNYIFMYAMFFDTPALSKYRYWLRVDAEIWLTEPIIEDPFALMARSDWVFSYRLEPQMKNVACNRDLPAAVRSFAESRGIEPRDRGFFERYLNGTACFIGNIGAGQVSFFRSEKYRSLVEFVLGTGNVWTLRWDDQHMYAMAVALFSTGEHIGRLPIRVCHRVEDDCDHHLEPSLAARQAARGSGARGGPPS